MVDTPAPATRYRFGPAATPEFRKRTLRDDAIRALIAKHGGGFHGPHVEHLSMEERAFWRMIHEALDVAERAALMRAAEHLRDRAKRARDARKHYPDCERSQAYCTNEAIALLETAAEIERLVEPTTTEQEQQP